MYDRKILFAINCWDLSCQRHMQEHWLTDIEMMSITSPCDLAAYLEFRRRFGGDRTLRIDSSAEVFVFGLGDPPLPDMTKFGGSPFRPPRLPWPKGDNEKPATFVCQFRMVE